MSTDAACPIVSLNALYYFFQDGYIFFGLIAMAGGGWMIVEGGKHYRVTMFVSAMISVAFLLLFIMFADVFPSNSPTWVVWLTLTCALGMGSGIGFAA